MFNGELDPYNGKKIDCIECRFVTYVNNLNTPSDAHIVKELIHYEDGTSRKNLRVIENFKRPIWVTKPFARNHEDKKETELLKNLDMFLCRERDKIAEIKKRLPNTRYNSQPWDLFKSPYLYGADITSEVLLKSKYMANCDKFTPFDIGVLDFEADVDDDIISIGTYIDKEGLIAYYTEKLVEGYLKVEELVEKAKKKYIDQNEWTDEIREVLNKPAKIVKVKNELDLIVNLFKDIHSRQPDILIIHNTGYDINLLIKVCDRHGYSIKELFRDPRVDKRYAIFDWHEDDGVKITESGVRKVKDIEEKWNVLRTSASFWVIDSMSLYNYIRVGASKLPGGYNLDNLLKVILGASKLRIDDPEAELLKGTEWHRYMSKNKPIDYIIYGMFDVIRLLEAMMKTGDADNTLPLTSGHSNFDVFNSGPRRIINELFFYYLDKGRVLGVNPPKKEKNSLLGLDKWIVTLNAFMIGRTGLDHILEGTDIDFARVYVETEDADAVSSYPSNTIAANISSETTMNELLEIEGIEKEKFKENNINIMFGPVNALSYVQNMTEAPDLFKVKKWLIDKGYAVDS